MYGKSTKKVKRSSDFTLGIAVGAIYARTQDAIDSVADQSGHEISRSQLARGLADVLHATASGGLLDGAERLPGLRGSAAQGHALGSTAKAVHVRPRRKRASPLKAKGRRKPGRPPKAKGRMPSKATMRGVKAYWESMSPDQRSAEMKRRQAIARESNKRAA
jgi:hypothetical protein